MTGPNRRYRSPAPQGSTPSTETPETLAPKSSSDSVPVGVVRVSGLVKTANGYAVAQAELSPEEWQVLKSKKLGKSQHFKEFVAQEHKRVVMALGQLD